MATDARVTVTDTAAQVMPDTAGNLATRAYARLAADDRRAAVRLFDAALAIGDPRASAWTAQRRALTRRWSGSAYSIIRARGIVDLAVTPVLGGSQSGGGLAFVVGPLARRPFALTVRGSIAHDDGGRSALAAVGIAWHPAAGITLTAERLIPIGPAARGDWTVRVASGAARTIGGIETTAYGEAGVVGQSTYAAAQARAGWRLSGDAVSPGIGAWASVQHGGGRMVNRVDLGPGITVHAHGISLAIDYRFRVTGNAAPGSGPVLTLGAAF